MFQKVNMKSANLILNKSKRTVASAIVFDVLISLAIAVFVVASIFVATAKVYLETREKNEAETMAKSYSNYLNVVLAEPINQIKSVKIYLQSLQDVGSDAKKFFNDSLTSLSTDDAYFNLIEITDRNGKVVFCSSHNHSIIGTDRSKSFAFNEAKKDRDLHWSDTFTSEIDGKTTLTLSYQFQQYMVIGYLNFSKISQLAFVFGDKNQTKYQIMITDANGVYIYHHDQNLVNQRRIADEIQLIKKIYYGEKTRIYAPFEGINATVSVEKPVVSNWYLVYYSDSRLLKNTINYVVIALIVLMLLLIVAVLWMVLRRTKTIMCAVKEVSKQSGEIAVGNFSNRIQKQHFAELDHLASNFNVMMDEIRQRDLTLQNIAYSDPLTHVLNRAGFVKTIKMMTDQKRNECFAFVYIDIDNFKRINDSFGHVFGDKVLVSVVQRIQNVIGNTNVIARMGGDEIVIIVPCDKLCRVDSSSCDQLYQVVIIALEKLKNEFANPLVCEGIEIHVTMSFGISVFPKDGKEFGELMKCADAALYNAKENGKNCYCFFDPLYSAKQRKNYEIEQALKKALKSNEMFVQFQPQIFADGTVRGFETLLRWHNEKLGMIPPDAFISIAEKNREIIPIGQFVFKQACKAIAEINRRENKEYVVAVNFSLVELSFTNFFEFITSTIQKAGISPAWVEIEITERVELECKENLLVLIRKLKEFGCKIALDDFGTGYSSLSYLGILAINTLKIDRSFMLDIQSSDMKKTLVETIITLSHKLGIQVVAEGIEERQQVELLSKIGCDMIQGYYYSKPIAFDEIDAFLRKVE